MVQALQLCFDISYDIITHVCCMPYCRLRQDVEQSGGQCASFDQLRDVRSLEYEVDLLTQKLKKWVACTCMYSSTCRSSMHRS